MSRDESRRSKRCRADRDFDMSANIMVNDYDDERTLDEEEALEGSEDTHNELSHLQKESDMPLKDLLVMYGISDMSCQDPNKAEDDDEDDEEDEEEEEDDEDEDDDDPANYESDLKQFYTEMVKAEENNTNAKRPSTTKTGDLSQCDDTTVTVANVNTHITTSNIDPKMESDTGTGLADSNDAHAAADTNTNLDNTNSVSGVSTGENIGTGGGGGGGGGGSSRLLRSVSRPQSEEEEDDCDYSPDEEEWKKTIMVGSDYQAAIPEGLCKYDDALPYENEDKMLWDPSHISEEEVEEFLERAQLPVVKGTSLPNGNHVRDDEQALYLLLQCGYNLEEALRRRRMNVLPSTESVSLWSEEECHNFETGLRNYGKDFHLIQKNKVRTRSVGELVQFYYLWKKTERHDIFTYKARLEKKKYALHPGITDYMDRFLEEQEGVRDRSSSPNVHCLLYGDAKRQRTNVSVTSNEEQQQQNQQPNRSGLDNWENSNNVTTSSTTTTNTSSNSGGGSSGTNGPDNSTPVNSGPMDPLAIDHQHHNLSTPPVSVGQLDHAKANNTASAESSSTTIQSWSSSTITTTTSSSSSSLSSSMQQQQRNHYHHNQAMPSNNSASIGNGTNVEEANVAIAATRSPENILPNLPS